MTVHIDPYWAGILTALGVVGAVVFLWIAVRVILLLLLFRG